MTFLKLSLWQCEETKREAALFITPNTDPVIIRFWNSGKIATYYWLWPLEPILKQNSVIFYFQLLLLFTSNHIMKKNNIMSFPNEYNKALRAQLFWGTYFFSHVDWVSEGRTGFSSLRYILWEAALSSHLSHDIYIYFLQSQ